MAVIGENYLDIIDALKRTESEDNLVVATVIELLRQENAFLDDAQAVPCNLGTKHRTTVRTGLPSVAWGKLYQGIAQSKSQTQQVDDTTGFLEGLSTVDKRLLQLYQNPDALRMTEAMAFLEALSQNAASTLLYGDVETDPEKFTGLHPRFSSLSAPNGGQIVDALGASSDNTSVWFLTWSPMTCQLLYPSNTRAGIQRTDHGMQRVTDGSGNAYYAEEEEFTWHMGLTTRDWRQISRVANIDVSNLQAGSVDIYKYMRKAFWKLRKHRIMDGKIAIYANADVLEALDADSTPTTSTTASYVRLKRTEVDGQEVISYRGIPIRQVDAILNTEAEIT